MKVYLECVPCFLRQALEASKMATRNPLRREMAVKEVLRQLGKMSLRDKTPPEIGYMVHRVVRKVTGNPDPYRKVKDEFNRKAKQMYPSLKDEVEKSQHPLLTATRIAIAGNIIDFGPTSRFDLEHTIRDVLSRGFAIDHFKLLEKALEKAETVAYLGDNAGEIFFDRVLLEELEGKRITFVVKGGPHINDATVADAKFAGIHEIAEIKTVSNGEPGTGPRKNSKRFINWLKTQDVVISKGQENYESLSEADANIFFLLRVKCPMIARDIGAPAGSTIVKHVGR